MARIDDLEARLQLYMECEAAILDGAQEYSIGSRRLTRADLKQIGDMIRYLEKEVAAERVKSAGRGRNRVIGIVPHDT